MAQVWAHPQVRAELVEVLELLRERVPYLDHPLGLPGVPLALHSRYTRAEILAAFGVGEGAKPPTWQTGVWWEPQSQTDLFAFTLDKSVGGFSPTTRYRDYAISPELIHWESQSATAADSATGQRYIRQREAGTNVRSVRPASYDRPRVLVPRPGVVREPRRRSSDRVRLEAPAPPSSGALHVVRGRRRVEIRSVTPGTIDRCSVVHGARRVRWHPA